MISEKSGKKENIQRVHYVILGFYTFKDVLKKLEDMLKFYRLEDLGVKKEKEIIYDTKGDLLSNAGIVISKNYHDQKVEFNVTKISMLPGEMKRPSQKFLLGDLEEDSEPRDFSLEVSAAIENLFGVKFTFDLDSIVRQTFPKIAIDIDKHEYNIIGGTGYRAKLSYENNVYRDVASNNKVTSDGVTLKIFLDEKYQEENKKILDMIERKIKELGLFDLSRFEIAKKLLYPPVEEDEEGGEGEE